MKKPPHKSKEVEAPTRHPGSVAALVDLSVCAVVADVIVVVDSDN